VTAVSQVGTDRIIEITFSDGQYRLFLEFYAGGNIVLTDGELSILGLLRNVSEGAEHEQYRLGLKYDLEQRQNFGGVPELTKERLREGLGRAVERQREEAGKPGKKQKVKKGDALRKALAVTTTEFPPVLIDHVLLEGGFDREILPEIVVQDEELLGKLLGCLERAGEVLKEITSAEVAKGYIVAKRKNNGATQEVKEGEEQQQQQGGLLYEDFHPFKPAQLVGEGVEFIEYEGFNKAVDEFFSSIEGQRLESKLQEREDAARRKIDQARQEQERRIEGLQQTADLNVQKAQAIEANVERVEEAVAAVNGLIAQGMDWVDIGRLIENEQARQNPVAQTIKTPLKLHENTVTLLLSGYDDVIDDEEMADETDSEASDSEAEDTPAGKARAKPEEKRLAVDIDLAQSPWANARLYYDQRRTATVKQEKTVQASVKALKSTEQRVMADLKKGLKQEKDVLRPVRKQMWFEKFTYFVSSDGYLVLAGKDVQQIETLYRRYLKKGDAYVHADLPGAASVIIKNNPATPGAPIPPSTLSQAGNLSVCTSNAWDSKAIMSAWWVLSEHVSKIAPTGEYLAAGSFNIKAKKNFLPPAQLLLGFGVLFQISEESKARHFKNRLGETATTASPADGASVEQEIVEELAQEQADDDDEDDEFPDAGKDADDDDDDFPDAQDDEQVHEDHEVAVRSNPLQSKGAVAGENDDDDEESSSDDDSDDDQEEPQAESSEPPEAEAASKKAQSTKQSGKQAPKAEPKQQQPKKMTRGKRGKAKRQAAKYAEQDDDDRELAMKLLGSRAAEERREAEAAEKVVQKESAEEARARRRAQHEKAQKEGLEAEEMRRLTLEEGAQELDEEEAAQMAQLDAFVGTPLPGDEILEAIPVCGPWTAMAKYKYKVKLQPGQQKKGKAIREILIVWNKAGGEKKNVDSSAQDKEMIWPREAELVKGLKEVEVVGIVPVKTMRVMMSGGAGGAEKKGKGGAKARGSKRGKGSKKK
jgi:predicted ribosome quality control (RQC) complex YloA/Tae2 family protein